MTDIERIEFARQMRSNCKVENGLLTVSEELWLQIANIVEEKQVAKKVLGIGIASEYGYEGNDFTCGVCPTCASRHIISKYCEDCGQRLDWDIEE